MTAKADKKTILVVEDEMDMRFFLATLLETNGYQPITAKNGRQGIAQARLRQPDLIILDVMMPEQGGLIMYSQIKDDAKLRPIPIIMLSAVGKGTFQHSLAMLNGHRPESIPLPDAYIEKPPEPDKVLQTIRRFI